MELIQYDKPVDRARAFMIDYARQLYGIENASALAPLVEIAFDQGRGDSLRIQAARELLKYTEVPTRSLEYDGGKSGPDLEITVLGSCEIKEPDREENDGHTNTQQVAPTATPNPPLELPDGRGKESG